MCFKMNDDRVKIQIIINRLIIGALFEIFYKLIALRNGQCYKFQSYSRLDNKLYRWKIFDSSSIHSYIPTWSVIFSNSDTSSHRKCWRRVRMKTNVSWLNSVPLMSSSSIRVFSHSIICIMLSSRSKKLAYLSFPIIYYRCKFLFGRNPRINVT